MANSLSSILGYPIAVGSGFAALNAFIRKEYSTARKVLLVDSNTLKYCLPLMNEHQVDELTNAEIVEIEPGEENKTIATCEQLWHTLADLNMSRNDVLINLGGGVVGDMGGFVGATFKRGIHFIQVPTTLLAMVDASVGGKLGVDLGYMKNYVGIFQSPKAVFVMPEFLKTLPSDQLLAGYAEMLKHGLIADKEHLEAVLNAIQMPSYLPTASLIETSIGIKADVVHRDFHENGERKTLNFGHTVGHAIESHFIQKATPVLHGEAVAAGLWCELFISCKHLGFSSSAFTTVGTFLRERMNLPHFQEDTIPELLTIMQGDKKNRDENVNFTLLKSIGVAIIDQQPSLELIEESLRAYLQDE